MEDKDAAAIMRVLNIEADEIARNIRKLVRAGYKVALDHRLFDLAATKGVCSIPLLTVYKSVEAVFQKPVDELKETQAAILRLNNGLSTLEEEKARLGTNWCARLRELKAQTASGDLYLGGVRIPPIEGEVNLDLDDGNDFGKTMKSSNVHQVQSGVTINWLMQAFQMRRSTIIERLKDCPVVRVTDSGVKVYELPVAARHLIDPPEPA